MYNPEAHPVEDNIANKFERNLITSGIASIGLGVIELSDAILARPEYRPEGWWRNVVGDLTLTGTGIGELHDNSNSTFRRVGKIFNKIKDVDPDRVAAFIQAGQSVITSRYADHAHKPDRVEALGRMYGKILTDSNLERGRERAHQQYLDAIIESHNQGFTSPVLESWLDSVKNESYGVSSSTALRVGSLPISDYEMDKFLNSKVVKTASPEVKEILYEEVARLTLGSINGSNNQEENDVMGRAYTKTVEVTADAFGERFIAKFAKEHDKLGNDSTPLKRVQKLQESAPDFDAAFENLTSPATSFGGKVDLSAAVISVINATRKAVGSRGQHMQGVVSNILVEKALALVGNTDSPKAKELASEMMNQYLLSGQDAIHKLMLSLEKDDQNDEKQVYIGKVVSEAIANIIDPNYGAGESHDLSGAVKSRFNRFLKVAVNFPETTQSEVYKEATSALLTAIKSQRQPRKKEELVSLYKIVASKLSSGHASAEMLRISSLTSVADDDRRLTANIEKYGTHQMYKDNNPEEIKADLKKRLIEAEMKRFMGDRWNAYLDAQLDPNLSEGSAKGLHEAFEIEKNAFEEGLKTMDSEFTVAYLRAGVDGYLKRIKNLDIADDRNLRMVREVLALMTGSPIAQSLAAREETGKGARKSKTLEEGVQFHFFREAHKLGLSGKFAQFIQANSEKDSADVQLCVYMLRLSSLSDLQRKSDPEKTGLEDVDYGMDPTAAEFETYIGSMIAAFESNKSDMLNGKAHIALPEIAAMIQIFAPDTFMRLASTVDVEKGAKGRRKAKMSTPERQAVADIIKAMDISDEAKANLIYQATGKLVPYAGVAQRFAGSDVGETLKSAFAMGGKSALVRWLRLNKYDGENKTVPGKSSVLAKMQNEDPVLNQKRAELFGLYIDLKMSRITDEAFQKGGQLTDLAASELLEVSMMLENTPGEDNAVKEKVYDRFSDLLIRVITNISKDPDNPDNKPFNDKLVKMAHTVLKTSVAYWPEEKVDDFIDKFKNRADNVDLGIWIEGDNWMKTMHNLVVAKEEAATKEEVTNGFIRRRIAEKVCAATLELVRGDIRRLGGANQNSIGDDLIGKATEAWKDSTREKPYKGSLPYQAALMVSWYGSKTQKNDLPIAFQELVRDDTLRFAKATNSIPVSALPYLEMQGKLIGLMREDVDQIIEEYATIMAGILGNMEPLVKVGDMGQIIVMENPSTLLGDLEQRGTDIAKAMFDRFGGDKHKEKITQLASGQVGIDDNGGIRVINAAIRSAADGSSGISQVGDAIAQLGQGTTLNNKENGGGSSGARLNFSLNSADQTGVVTTALAATAQAEAARAGAAKDAIQAILGDRQAALVHIMDVLDRTGVLGVGAKDAEIKKALADEILQMLTHRKSVAAVAYKTLEELAEVQAEEMKLIAGARRQQTQDTFFLETEIQAAEKADRAIELATVQKGRDAKITQRAAAMGQFIIDFGKHMTSLIDVQSRSDVVRRKNRLVIMQLNEALLNPSGSVAERVAEVVRKLGQYGTYLNINELIVPMTAFLEGSGSKLSDFGFSNDQKEPKADDSAQITA